MVNVTLRCVPAFTLHAVNGPRPLDEVLEGLDAFVDGNEHAEFFIFPHCDQALTRANNRTSDPPKPRSKVGEWVR